ncbi:MAG TPA: glycosyltransferase [Puia sp.]|nr:glycosyltransferase [Puia sp.]
MGKRIVVTVISDLVTDQRVHKVCRTLHEHGYEVLLIGARRRGSLPLNTRSYKARRIRVLFQKKVFFYAEFNLRLFFLLLFTPADIFLGNDLDVMAATYLASKIRRRPVVYDTHEYYMGMPELNGKPFIKKVWGAIEAWIFPRLRYVYTICDSFCELYKKDYGKELKAVRNVPYLDSGAPSPQTHRPDSSPSTPESSVLAAIDSKIPRYKHILLFQGAGINPERGVEELVLAMRYLDPVQFHLLIIGGGDIFDVIKEMVSREDLGDRITIFPKVPFEVLRHITRQAHLGLSLDKPTNINHIYGLPNKIFDYLHSGVPILVSRLVELEKIVNEYQVGTFIENHEPRYIASCIREVFDDPERLLQWRKNSERVRRELNWEKESRIVLEIFEQVELQNS